MKYSVLLGRILFAAIFILSAPGDFKTGIIQYAASQGVPLASVAVPLAGILALVGGLSVLLGLKARWGAVLLLVFLVPVTLFMHNFWTAKDAAAPQMQQIHFMKNLALMGGTLVLAYFGSGPLSLDSWLMSRRIAAPHPAHAPASS